MVAIKRRGEDYRIWCRVRVVAAIEFIGVPVYLREIVIFLRRVVVSYSAGAS